MRLTLSEILRTTSLEKPSELIAGEYLAWHYRLLREDLFGPLRRDLTKLRLGSDSQTDSLIHHGKVLIVERTCEEIDGITLGLRIRRNNYEMGQESSNRLIPGTLVFLTDENRQNYIFGVISNIKSGGCDSILTVECSTTEDIILEEYVLYEYTVYYEAYIHSLNNLKKYPDVPFLDLITGKRKVVERSNLFKKTLVKLTAPGPRNEKVGQLSDVAMVHRTLMAPRDKQSEASEDTWLDLNDQSQEDNLQDFDSSQRLAILESLRKEMCLIQGPPGTGKSFVGSQIVKILLDNAQSFSSKFCLPILVICYTNTALDQFLQLLLYFTKRIMRLGSRSQSKLLEPNNLSSLRAYMSESMLRKQSDYENEKELIRKINFLKNSVRSDQVRDQLQELTEDLFRARLAEDSRLCRRADVLGVTVTGAAKHRELLEFVKPSIVIVEEAGEILESHLMAGLPSSVRHLVMIGDHRQLRPTTANFQLLQRHPEFGVSLFERLVEGGVETVLLSTQHRMAPEIARLVRPVYPHLQNHPSVQGRPPLPGFNKRLLFLTHNIAEDTGRDRSKSNRHEAEMVVGIAKLLITLGVKAQEIVILVAYLGQLRVVRRLLETSGLQLKTDSVDNFQGEESEVVVLSLVRSGAGTIGFLGQENRATVALTRARRGLVVVGNIDQLCDQSQLWQSVRTSLVEADSLVESLQLTCHTHGVRTEIRTVQDFALSPLGGCESPCRQSLACGHLCALLCHPTSTRHQCNQPCEKMCPNNLHKVTSQFVLHIFLMLSFSAVSLATLCAGPARG